MSHSKSHRQINTENLAKDILKAASSAWPRYSSMSNPPPGGLSRQNISHRSLARTTRSPASPWLSFTRR